LSEALDAHGNTESAEAFGIDACAMNEPGGANRLAAVSPVAESGWIVDPCASARRGRLSRRLLFG